MTGIQYKNGFGTPRLDLADAMWEYMFSEMDFIGMRAFPMFRTPEKTGTFPKVTRENFRPSDTKRARNSRYNRDDIETEDDTYLCVEDGHEKIVGAVDSKQYSSYFDAELVAARLAMWRCLYTNEIETRDKIIDAATFTGELLTTASTAWSDAGADIINDVQVGIEAVRKRTGREPNTLVLPAASKPYFMRNNKIRETIKYVERATIEALARSLAPVLGVQQVLFGKGVYNSAAKNKPAVMTDIWPVTHAALLHAPAQGAPLEEMALGRTMLWDDETPDGVLVEEYPEPQTRGLVIRARLHSDKKRVDVYNGQLIDIVGS